MARAKGKRSLSSPWIIACSCLKVFFSYLLQDWDQELAVEQAYSQVSHTMARMLRLPQHVDSLEGMTRHMATDTAEFHDACRRRRQPRKGKSW